MEDQGQLGSCTANALAGNLEFLRKKAARLIDPSCGDAVILARVWKGCSRSGVMPELIQASQTDLNIHRVKTEKIRECIFNIAI